MSDTVPSHRLNLHKPYLKLIADGIKTVEVRVGYPKMRRIQTGHELRTQIYPPDKEKLGMLTIQIERV